MSALTLSLIGGVGGYDIQSDGRGSASPGEKGAPNPNPNPNPNPKPHWQDMLDWRAGHPTKTCRSLNRVRTVHDKQEEASRTTPDPYIRTLLGESSPKLDPEGGSEMLAVTTDLVKQGALGYFPGEGPYEGTTAGDGTDIRIRIRIRI